MLIKAYTMQFPRRPRRSTRHRNRGITILEVLVAAGIAVVGILSVGALVPLGVSQVREATRTTDAWVAANGASREVQFRGTLDPTMHLYGGAAMIPGTPAPPPPAGYPPPLPPLLLRPVALRPDPISNSRVAEFTQPFAVDPLFFARTGGYTAAATAASYTDRGFFLPYKAVSSPIDQTGADNPGADNAEPYQILRLTTRAWRQTTAWVPPAMGAAQAERDFSWPDDRVFLLPRDDLAYLQDFLGVGGGTRPVMSTESEPFTDSNNNTVHDGGESYQDVNGNGQFDAWFSSVGGGDLSWMLTVSPRGNMNASSPTPALVSVVVFSKRPGSTADDPATPDNEAIALLSGEQTPSERTVYAELRDGIPAGGRSVLLHYEKPALANNNYLNVRPNSWLMLSGSLLPIVDTTLYPPGTAQDPPPAAQMPMFDYWRKVVRWYRIVDVGEERPYLELNPNGVSAGTHVARYVTLAGPDWDGRKPTGSPVFPGGDRSAHTAWDPNNPTNIFNDVFAETGANDPPNPTEWTTVYATLFDTVVNVFEKSVELE